MRSMEMDRHARLPSDEGYGSPIYCGSRKHHIYQGLLAPSSVSVWSNDAFVNRPSARRGALSSASPRFVVTNAGDACSNVRLRSRAYAPRLTLTRDFFEQAASRGFSATC